MPTEAQWEYACRAGTTAPFNTGNYLTNLQANYNWAYPYNDGINSVTTYPGMTQAVGTYPANAWGLFDMHGNVWEWCNDWYGTYPTTTQTNPTGATTGSGRVIRGGSWYDYAQLCRSAFRYYNYPYNYNSFIGFRLVFVPEFTVVGYELRKKRVVSKRGRDDRSKDTTRKKNDNFPLAG